MLQQLTCSPPVCYAVLVAVGNSRHKLLEVKSAFIFAEYETLGVNVLELVCHVAGQAATCTRDNVQQQLQRNIPALQQLTDGCW